jgi:hypothetical protein
MATPVVFTAAVEGAADEVLLKRLCAFIGTSVGQVYGRYGKSYVLARMNGYNHSARFRHWVILLDLDDDGPCAADVVPRWLPAPSRLMRLRVAVRELESWLLADPERISKYLSVLNAEIPANPDIIPDPKRMIVDLATRSRRRAIREDMVPIPGSGQPVGPAYTSRMIEFIQNVESGWRPDVAARNSDSLRRCISAISRLAQEQF